MKKMSLGLGALLVALMSQAFALELETVDCRPKKDGPEELVFVLATQGQSLKSTGLIKRHGDGLLSADSCFSYKSAPLEVKQNLKSSEGIVALCVYITGDDGSGDLAVLKKVGTKYVAFFKQVVLGSPNTELGNEIGCSHAKN